MPASADTKTCLACGKPLKGRIDKKFCDDYCRNNYNNRQKASSSRSKDVRNITNALLKNRKIMETLLPPHEETAKASRDELLRLGFHFKYFTHYYTTRTGQIYYYCFEYGYLPIGNNWHLIVRQKER